MGLPARKNEAKVSPKVRLFVGPRYDSHSKMQMKQHGFKTLWWFVVGVFFIQAIANGWMFYNYSKSSDDYYHKRAALLRDRTPAQSAYPKNMVILGSSRTELGVNAPLIENSIRQKLSRDFAVINFSVTACAQESELLYWKRILKECKAPDMALIEVHPAFLNSKAGADGVEFNSVVWPVERFLRTDLDYVESHASNIRPNIRAEWMKMAFFSFYKNRISLLNSVFPAMVPNEFKGQVSILDKHGQLIIQDELLSSERKAKAMEHTRAQYYHLVQEMDLNSSRTRALRELLQSCTEQNVAVGLLLMPEGQQFQSWYGDGVWGKIQKYLQELAEEFGAEIFNAHEWMHEADFKDSHHLYQTGALRFTRRLTDENILPWVLQREKNRQKNNPKPISTANKRGMH